MAKNLSRRRFVQTTAAVTTAAAIRPVWTEAAADSKSPNEKLNVACVGVGGRGASDVAGVAGENIVALCDVDDKNLGSAGRRYKNAKTFNDYRKMLDELEKDIDAVVVATPDHMHAPISADAIVRGKHCYTEKPVAHNLFECRVLNALAKKHKVATQMGTQIHAGDNYRRVVELIKSGAIGDVTEAHVWAGKGWGNGRIPKTGIKPPSSLHWDMWAGVADKPPYQPRTYHPSNWRKFWEWGTGTLGDMGCHYADVVFWALDLHEVHPITAQADAPDKPHPEGAALNLRVELEYAARENKPAMKFCWYDGNRRPELMTQGKVIVKGKPQKWGSGVLFVGTKGMLLCNYGARHLLPEEQYKDFKAPEQVIPKSIGHHKEWIAACKGQFKINDPKVHGPWGNGGSTTCHFGYSGPLSEAILIGNVAYRVQKKLQWDGKNIKATNAPEANKMIRESYRDGWGLKGSDILNLT
jgi:predicted dehydrogenase